MSERLLRVLNQSHRIPIFIQCTNLSNIGIHSMIFNKMRKIDSGIHPHDCSTLQELQYGAISVPYLG